MKMYDNEKDSSTWEYVSGSEVEQKKYTNFSNQ